MFIPGLNSEQEAVLGLLDQARSARDESITETARLSLLPERRTTEQATLPAILGREVFLLMKRMDWLHEHPRRANLSRTIGTTSLQMGVKTYSRSYTIIFTEPTFSIEPELVGNHSLTEGFVFTKPYEKAYSKSHSWEPLKIDRHFSDVETGEVKQTNLYKIYTGITSNGVRVALPQGSKFDRWRIDNQMEAHRKYIEREPWAAGFRYMESETSGGLCGNFEEDVFGKQNWSKIFTNLHDYFRGTADTSSKKQEQRERLRKELLAQMQPGTTWDYPDEFYHFPLGLVMQANDLLGTKRPK